MDLFEEIKKTYPELTWVDFRYEGCINLQNNSDGTGDFIAKWDFNKPIPDSLKKYFRS